MAEQRIKRSDISEDDLFKLIGDSAEKNLKSVDNLNKKLNETTAVIKELFKGAKPDSLTGVNKIVSISKEMDAITKKAIETDKEKIQVTKTLTSANKVLTVEQQKQREATRQANLESKQVARLKLAEAGSIESLRAKLGLVTTAWTKLTKEEVENTKRGQRLNESKRKLTEELKRLEAATGDNRRNVGNYGKALDTLKLKFSNLIGLASQFGLALGGVALVRGALNVVRDFDQGIADLASVIGKTRPQIQALEEDARRLGASTRFTASEVAALQVEFAKLGFSEKEILDATQATLELAAATNTEMARAAEVAGLSDVSRLMPLVDMLEADALAVHLNPLQEFLQPGSPPLEFLRLRLGESSDLARDSEEDSH